MLLGVAGSIAAYKALILLRALVREGARVSVVMTESATKFVAPRSFEVLSRQPVASTLFDETDPMPHLTLAEWADVILIAPATANTLVKCAVGFADDLLSTVVLAAQCPIILAPAMDGGMWEHPAVVAHVRTLRERGVIVLDPEEGELASGQIGRGRFPAESTILEAVKAQVCRVQDLCGQRVVISAGPTREPLDAVRFLTNASSGKMGYALAKAAVARGAEVVLVSGPTALSPPAGVDYIPVVTAQEMYQAIMSRFPWATVVIMAAAVSDFRPRESAAGKLNKQEWYGKTIELEPTIDILATLSRKRTHQIVVGFAAETHDLLTHGREKLRRKDVDLMIVNDVGSSHSAFGSDDNQVIILSRHGEVTHTERMPKIRLAQHVWDHILRLIQARPSTPALSCPESNPRT
ncbi:MAG: bifunctional phosphopantothenoylcysteine decarboxylase/phosphopantothenate--cysteine ligase CoaBC [Nitrospirae bacterium]|nr:MAG: bifunctional phosphopantothenoylcysteine decarboxylase/phosphopantothenate--cysteine ligase CoaBC [Nitrospirota bacterium]